MVLSFPIAALILANPALLIGTAVCALVGVIFALYARSSLRKQQRLTHTQTSKIGRLRGGFAEVKGQARASESLVESPLSRTRCVYFHFLVEEHVNRGKNSYWRKVIEDKQDAGCMIDDGTGEAAIRLSEAELLLKPDTHARSGTFRDASPDMEEALAAYGRSSKGFIFNKNMRYTETVLKEGDPLYVIGTAKRRGEGSYEFEKAGDLFIVSDEAEEVLASRFNRGRLVGTIGGIAMGLGALAFTVSSMASY